MSQVSDTFRLGAAYYGAAGQTDGGELGFPLSNVAVVQFGAVVTLDPDGICVAATATSVKTLSATGALVSGGIATFDIPRCVTLTSTSNQSAKTFTVTGTDRYGQTQTDKITGPNNTTVKGKKAFKTVTSIVNSAAITGNISAGSGDIYGLPYHLANKGKFLGYMIDGVQVTPTIVAGFSTTGTATSTTADDRGTVTATTASNGSRYFTAIMLVDPTTKAKLYGTTPG